MTAGLTPADHVDLLGLVHRYAAAIDARDWDAAAALFTSAARLAVPEPPASMAPSRVATGRDEVRALLEPLEAFARTRHDVTGSTWTADGPDHAHGRTTCVAHHVERDRPVAWVWHLEYADHAVRTPDGWLLAARELHLERIERATPGPDVP